MITEDYVSFEVAKLLKDKGFDGETHTTFDKEGYTQLSITHQMAMKWLREVHHLYVQVMLDSWACGGHTRYYVVIQNTTSGFEMMFFEMMLQDALDNVFYDSYEDAVEAALKYSLENLI